MPLLFVVTLFASASLLFMVQPMVGRMILPLLGGSPAVWNACMVFFQALLLAGYLYADRISNRVEPKRQWVVHFGVMMLPVAAMAAAVILGAKGTPIAIVEGLSNETRPILGVLALLMVAIGVPFFVASTSAPLLQKWFAFTGHPSARDPYFLYAASNAGSLISLLGYPILIEPNLGLKQQAWLFGIAFLGLIGLILLCGRAAANPSGKPPPPTKGKSPLSAATPVSLMTNEAPPTLNRKLRWLALSFVPSSLMLGVTFYMTTDIASIPLLWVIPLGLYLVTFIIAFGRVPAWFRMVIGNLAPVMILLLVFLLISGVAPGTGIELLLHLLTFFAAALMCHYELACDRPASQFLTNYYLWISLGGVLGGVFNALIAPLVFPLAFEYPITLVLACFLVPTFTDNDEASREKPYETNKSILSDPFGFVLDRCFPQGYNRQTISRVLDFILPVFMGGLLYFMVWVSGEVEYSAAMRWMARRFVSDPGNTFQVDSTAGTISTIVKYAVPIMLCFFFVERPVRFALSVAVILGFSEYRNQRESLIHSDRSFFGILKVQQEGLQRKLIHGTTLHGTQFFKNHPADYLQMFGVGSTWDSLVVQSSMEIFKLPEQPLTYYHRTGPVGAMFRELESKPNGAKSHFAMIGLGTGSVSCYAHPGQNLTFYEIDPTVIKLVEPDKYFTYISDAKKRGANIEFVLGDARLRLQNQPDRKYSLLLVDAFSSDSIPVHLLTTEAVQLYMDRITDDGFFALHISNKFVRLEPVVAAIAKQLGLTAWVWNDSDDKQSPGKTMSSWVVLAKDPSKLGKLITPAGKLLGKYERIFNADLLENILAMEAVGKDLEDANKTIPELEKILAAKDPSMAELLSGLIRKYHGKAHLPEVMVKEYGHAFRPVEEIPGVKAWTDDYADVLQVMMIKEVQAMRRMFGIPTPVKE